MPTPSSPNYDIYKRIGIYTFLITLLICFQSYINRWKSALAGCVFIERDLERSVWLYNHLLAFSTSLGLIKRKKASENYRYSHLRQFFAKLGSFMYHVCNFAYSLVMFLSCYYLFCCIPRISIKSIYLRFKSFILMIRLRYTSNSKEYCTGCALEPDDDESGFMKCSNRACEAIYCLACYAETRNQCTMCKFYIVVDSDNESMEKDSSDSEEENESCKKSKFSLQQSEILLFESDEDDKSRQSKELDYFQKSKLKKKEFCFMNKELNLCYQNIRKSVVSQSVNHDEREISSSTKTNEKSSAHNWLKYKTEINHYELRQAHKIIRNSYRKFFIEIEHLFGHKLFGSILTTSMDVREIFYTDNKSYEIFDESAKFVLKKFIKNMELADYFDLKELKMKSFYEYLKGFDEKVDFFI